MKTISEIEGRRKNTFMGTLNEISGHFREVYSELTKGNAELALETPGDIESGLMIKASPPGKKLLHIDSMSGGEKTLTAFAFLFAIQRHKPAPFYILDEADAALDKPNSERLAHMIKTRTEDSQFIVITHNNPMIHVSDQIVGVSMNKEKGSSIVEVDLKRLEASEAPNLK